MAAPMLKPFTVKPSWVPVQSGGAGQNCTRNPKTVPGLKQGSQKATIGLSSSGQPIMLRKLGIVKTSFTTPLS